MKIERTRGHEIASDLKMKHRGKEYTLFIRDSLINWYLKMVVQLYSVNYRNVNKRRWCSCAVARLRGKEYIKFLKMLANDFQSENMGTLSCDLSITLVRGVVCLM